jgi:hypothetical protein
MPALTDSDAFKSSKNIMKPSCLLANLKYLYLFSELQIATSKVNFEMSIPT